MNNLIYDSFATCLAFVDLFFFYLSNPALIYFFGGAILILLGLGLVELRRHIKEYKKYKDYYTRKYIRNRCKKCQRFIRKGAKKCKKC